MTSSPAAHDSVMDPSRLSLADTYAEALICQLDDQEIDEVDAELQELESLCDGVEGFQNLICYSLISRRERRDLVARVFEGRCSQNVYALLRTLTDHDRMPLLRTVCRRFHKMHDTRHGRVDVTVTTAHELEPAQEADLERRLGQALRIQPLITARVDKSLLGGMIVRVGDRLYDASLATQLRKLRRRIAARIADEL